MIRIPDKITRQSQNIGEVAESKQSKDYIPIFSLYI